MRAGMKGGYGWHPHTYEGDICACGDDGMSQFSRCSLDCGIRACRMKGKRAGNLNRGEHPCSRNEGGAQVVMNRRTYVGRCVRDLSMSPFLSKESPWDEP